MKRADTAFALASRGQYEQALHCLTATEQALGRLTQYRFGIEPTLLEIFLRGYLLGLKPDDYDWAALKRSILSASEYNAAEKLHLMLYLEELATTAGFSLPTPDLVNRAAPTERVEQRLIRRFPKLSEA